MGTQEQAILVSTSIDGGAPRPLTVRAGVHTVYCDEAGFTGNNLLDHTQPVFAYSAVTVEAEEAADIVGRIVRDRGIQGGELKAANLVKTSRGRETAMRVLQAIDGRYAVTFHHKKYALAGKFFEYIFEPALQKNNKFFYDVNFHKFVANVLYLHFAVGDASAEELLTDFQALMRARNDAGLRRLFSTPSGVSGMEDVLAHMCDFALGYREEINEELESLQGNDAVGKWVLDLTGASLITLLAHWGQRLEQLDVYCDKSKPLQAGPGLLGAMVGREDRIYSNIAGHEVPLTFNLARLPQFVDSKSHPGIQLADVVSGMAAFVSRYADGEGKDLYPVMQPHWTENGNVFPELGYADLRQKRPVLNACLLMELASRARNGHDPLYDIVPYYAFLDQAYDERSPALGRRQRRGLKAP